MFENSPAGLRMLAAEVSVTVTREEQHQGVLAGYPVRPGEQRRIAVELAWCRIAAGKYKGKQAIEVRVDGRRVGELTYLMSQRYGPLVTQALAAGARPGCEAYLEHDPRGKQVTLRLPAEATATVVLPAARPAPAAAASTGKPAFTKSEKRGAWIVAGAAVFVLVVIMGVVGGNDDDSPTTALSDDITTTTTVEPPPTTTTTTTPPPTTTTTTTTVPAPPPQTQQPVAPPPPPQTQQPVAPPPQTQDPAPSGCDPNYSGCVPIASDVDCAGGSGNGPAYADGPVDVVGNDIYGLDKDGDGVACE